MRYELKLLAAFVISTSLVLMVIFANLPPGEWEPGNCVQGYAQDGVGDAE